ncbi:CoA ester lyase [Nocardioides dubius]|uniref:CoA ester lyase n=1 Tax=Nocardioides dubius TaxID=317019 RepID=A0ABP4EKN6_9ACTN
MTEMLARSALYVPGDAPDKLRKALDRGSDELIVDLEDAVQHANKPLARDTVATWLDALPETPVEVWVRVNPGEEREKDVRAVAGCPGLAGLVVAKVEEAAELHELDALLTSLGSSARVVPLLESANAVLNAREIARGPRVARLQIGEADLRADVGVVPGDDERELLFARSSVIFASAAAGIAAPMAPVSVQFRDLDAYRASTEALRRLGFMGRACIHPAQVPVANAVFTPGEDEVARAQALLARFDGGAAVGLDVDGRMVDEAVLRQARSVLARRRG